VAKQDAKDLLSIKVSHADMLAYTDQVYEDVADPSINGIEVHAVSEVPHNLPARFAAVQSQINDINDELATKLDSGDLALDGKADVAGDTFTGTVTFAGGDEAVVINGPEQTDRSIRGKTSGVNRWEVALASNDNEQGSDSGSNLVVARFADDGTFKGIPFAIDRATGVTYIDQLAVGGGDILVGEGVDVRVQPLEPTDNLKIGTIWLRPGSSGGGPAIPNIPSNGLISHIAASGLALNNLDRVTSVDDLSGALNPASGANGGPVYLEGATPNGSPAMRGSSSNGYLNLSPTLYSGKTAGHIFVYYATLVDSAVFPFTVSANTANTIISDTLGTTANDNTFFNGTFTYDAAASPRPVVSWRIYEAKHDGTTLSVYIDGTLQKSFAAGFSPGTGGTLLRNKNTDAGSSNMIADFIAYDRALTTQEAADVRAALVTKNGDTGPIKDKQHEAVQLLTPWLHLPLTNDGTDYSGNNNHAVLGHWGNANRIGFSNVLTAPWPKALYLREYAMTTGYIATSAGPDFDSLSAFSFSYWTIGIMRDHRFGSNMIIGDDGGTFTINGTALTGVPLNQSIIQHKVIVWESGVLKYYINSNLAVSIATEKPVNSAGNLYVAGERPAQVNLQHLAFFNYALTQPQISSLTKATYYVG
jgi:hypothetical protein